MTQLELAEKAQVDVKTIGSLETRGRWPIARSRAGIERALGWPVGEMERIASREGVEPEPKPELDDDQELLETLRRVYRDDPDGPEKIRTVLRAVAAHEASGRPRSA